MSLGDIKELSLIIDTDDQRFGGQGVPDTAVSVKNGKAVVLLPPFTGRMYIKQICMMNMRAVNFPTSLMHYIYEGVGIF